MNPTQRKLDTLKHHLNSGQWFGRVPYGAYRMDEAAALVADNTDLVIALVAWWGDEQKPLVAGLTWCEVLEAQPQGFRVALDTEPQQHEATIPADEVVMLFFRQRYSG